MEFETGGARGAVERQPSQPGPRVLMNRRAGFTLMEVVIVLMLIGIIAVMAVPRILSAQQKMRIDAASQQLAIDLARARSEAVNRNQTITLTRDGNSYTIPNVGTRTLESDVVFVGGSATSVTFTTYGTLTPVASRTFTMQLGAETRMVVVSSAGFTSVK